VLRCFFLLLLLLPLCAHSVKELVMSRFHSCMSSINDHRHTSSFYALI
jgi:hypothetical protein